MRKEIHQKIHGTRQNPSGTNIIGGSYLGGNYWAQPDGQGFSQINPDTDGDGISNAEYTLAPGNVDRLPLTLMMGFPVHNLNSDLDFSSIQAAIDDPGTHDRDVIIVDSGTYHENVNITKRVTLREIIIL